MFVFIKPERWPFKYKLRLKYRVFVWVIYINYSVIKSFGIFKGTKLITPIIRYIKKIVCCLMMSERT